ncbi:spermidine synthase [Pigmentiphaga humi]|uniref:Spermidine synthase n=1 Tax=Pigmentiphaga humi TaxID=2478468 RepID=A0A3P4B6Q0_9BURK|nr:spermidine synthase [Pigmentiphaga humi]VCU71969.1 spermidine synthase [Pigmentiphaga humi]
MSRARQPAGRGRPAASGPSELDDPTFSEEDGVRYLHFGSPWVQGAMKVRSPFSLVLEYTRQMMAWLLFLEQPGADEDAIGTLGLGAGSLARYCLKHTDSRIQAVEWNPRVTAACRAYFRLPDDGERFAVTHADAGEWVLDIANRGTCRALMVDLYDHAARGPVRDSVAFYRGCRRVVSAHAHQAGVVTVNLFGAHESFEHNLRNLQEAFEGRVLLLPEIEEGNRVAIALAGPALGIDAQMLLARGEEVERRYGLPARKWARSLAPEAGRL